jgi:ABC-type branched-subunit amino acid transport system ATPase component/MFS family permease
MAIDTDAIEQVEEERSQLREKARVALGISGVEGEKPPPLRPILKAAGVGLYPLIALGVLNIVNNFQGFAFVVLGPDIALSLGISKTTITTLVALNYAAYTVAGLCFAAYVQHRPRRAAVVIVTAFIWAAATAGAGFVVGLAGMVFVRLLDGTTSASSDTVDHPLLMDTYPPDGRVRVFSYHQAFLVSRQIVPPLAIAILAGFFGLTWRGIFLVMGIICLMAACYAVRLRDPGFGHWDTGRVRELVRAGKVGARSDVEEQTRLGFFEICRRILMIPTQRRILFSLGLLGIATVPFQTFFIFYLDERWGLVPEERALFSAYVAAVAIVTLMLFAKRAEALFRRDPARLFNLLALGLFLYIVLIALGALMPVFWLMALCFGLSTAVVSAALPGLYVGLLSIVPPPMRAHASALAALAQGFIGGLTGSIFLGSIDRRYGVAGALVAISIPGVISALVMRSVNKTINHDLDQMIDAVIEEEEINKITASGRRLPLLACRHIDFSYGQVQVLFDVSFTVDEGEMVALLGTNGAGKSTLLRVISGLGLPSRGSVRFEGADITFLDAERRLQLGISQIPGRSIFDPLSVVDNLKLLSYSHGRDAKAIDTGIDASFEAFPVLAERRNQPAQTLSGGEQQMLALSKALILKPRLLLIDELSLGLAPTLIASLLETVRKINQAGTAVVLVEQSVNIALSLVQHAYFMERGQIRFDGRADELLQRDDLVRSVFLRGAAAAKEMK